jgi:hypothetical protein
MKIYPASFFVLHSFSDAESVAGRRKVMATNQAAFNAVVAAVQANQATFSPYLSGGQLSLNSQAITAADCITLASALRNNTSVTQLLLEGNSIGASGATALAGALQVNTVLQNLEICCNSIGDSGAAAIAQSLQVNTRLQILGLAENSIGNSGAAAIAQGLQVNTRLLTLSLAINTIGDSGATALAGALQVNTALQALTIQANSITTIGYNALTTALVCNYVLTTLTLDSTPAQITTYLARNAQCAGYNTPTLQCPIVAVNPLVATQNTPIQLSSANLQIKATTGTALNGNFVVSSITHGKFVNAQQQTITTFSQTNVNNGQVFIQADNSGLPITGNIIASYGSYSTCTIPLTFNVVTTTSTTPTTTSMTPVVTTTTTSSSITFTTSTATTTTLTSTAPSTITLQSSTSAPQTQSFAPNATVTMATTPTTTVTVTTLTATTLTIVTSTPTSVTTTITTSAFSPTAIPSSVPQNTSAPPTTSTQIFALNFTNSSLIPGNISTTALAPYVPSSSSSGIPIAPIAAGIVGGFVAGTAAFAYHRHRRRKQKAQQQLPVMDPIHPTFMHANPLNPNPPTAETQFGWGAEYETGAGQWSETYYTGDNRQIYAVPAAAHTHARRPSINFAMPGATDVDYDLATPSTPPSPRNPNAYGAPLPPHHYEYEKDLRRPPSPPTAAIPWDRQTYTMEQAKAWSELYETKK